MNRYIIQAKVEFRRWPNLTNKELLGCAIAMHEPYPEHLDLPTKPEEEGWCIARLVYCIEALDPLRAGFQMHTNLKKTGVPFWIAEASAAIATDDNPLKNHADRITVLRKLGIVTVTARPDVGPDPHRG